MLSRNYDCNGQMELTEYLQYQINQKKVKDFTNFVNQSDAQYTQIKKIVTDTFNQYKGSDQLPEVIANNVSVWVLNQSIAYMNYLREKSKM